MLVPLNPLVAAVGVPVIAPVLLLMLRPAGSVPVLTLQTNVPVLPVELNVCEYAEPTVPCANAPAAGVMVIVVHAPVIVYVFEPVQPLASVALTVNEKLPAAGGTPASCAVLPLIVIHAGAAVSE